jgi:hypothetical protein
MAGISSAVMCVGLGPLAGIARFLRTLDFCFGFHHVTAVGQHCSRPALQGISPKYCSPSTRCGGGFWRMSNLPKALFGGGLDVTSHGRSDSLCRRRYAVRSGLSTTARLAVEQPSVVSLPTEMRYVLCQRNLLLNCRQFDGYGSCCAFSGRILIRRSALEPWCGVTLSCQ